MITLEDQIRCYATDVAGPAMGDAPADLLEVTRPRHRGRWALVAALALFIAGLAYVATRPAGTTDPNPPSVTTPPIPQPTSWGGELGQCTDTTAGVPVQGPDGIGLCIGVGEPSASGTMVWLTVEGEPGLGMELTECQQVRADWEVQAGGQLKGERSASVFVVSDQVRTFVIVLPDGSRLAASTFELPGITGHRFAALWIPNPTGEYGPFEQYTATGELFTPQGTPPETPEWCPEHQLTR